MVRAKIKKYNKRRENLMEKTITVPTGYVRYLIQQVEKQGYDLSELLQSLGIDPTEIEQRTELSAIKFGQLYQRIMWTAQDESFGMLSGGQVPNGTFRMMCHAIIHCSTLERAIYRCSDFFEISRGTKVKPFLLRKGRYAKISFAPVSSVPEEELAELFANEPPLKVRTGLSMWQLSSRSCTPLKTVENALPSLKFRSPSS